LTLINHREEILNSLPQEDFDHHIESLVDGSLKVSSDENNTSEQWDGSDSLSLDSLKNNCHQSDLPEVNFPKEFKYCPTPVGYFQGVKHVQRSKHLGIRTNIACKYWNCSYCGPRKVKYLKRRIYRGEIAKSYSRKGFRPTGYEQKFLTLTAPGREYRNTHSPEEAYKEMQDHFHKLIRALKKYFGDFMYLRVVEPHKDGFPHLHVLLVGSAIVPKEILGKIRKLWVHTYGMGNVDLQVIKKGFRAGVKYITKYITKDIKQICKGSRIFSSSKNALEPLPKKAPWEYSKFYLGVIRQLKNDKPELFEIEIYPNMPERLTWESVAAVFQDTIDEFIHRVKTGKGI